MKTVRFGSFLKHLRNEKGLTMEQAADALGYSKSSSINNFESGAATPPLEKLPLIADLYEVSIDALVDELRKEVPAKAEGFDALRRWVFRDGAHIAAGRRGGVAADGQSAARSRYGYEPRVGADSAGLAVPSMAGKQVRVPAGKPGRPRKVGHPGAGGGGAEQGHLRAVTVCSSCPFRGQLSLVNGVREIAPAAAGRPPGGPPGSGVGGGQDETGKEVCRVKKGRKPERILPLFLAGMLLSGAALSSPASSKAQDGMSAMSAAEYYVKRRNRTPLRMAA